MITNEQNKRNTSMMYRVDPKRLSIKLCCASEAIEQAVDPTTTFETFSFERVKTRPEVPKLIGQLPVFVDGAFYCSTEEEAQEFIRKQIGM